MRTESSLTERQLRYGLYKLWKYFRTAPDFYEVEGDPVEEAVWRERDYIYGIVDDLIVDKDGDDRIYNPEWLDEIRNATDFDEEIKNEIKGRDFTRKRMIRVEKGGG